MGRVCAEYGEGMSKVWGEYRKGKGKERERQGKGIDKARIRYH